MKTSRLEKAAFTLYLIILVLSPLLFGAVHTYAHTIMCLGVLTAGLLLVKKNIIKEAKAGVYQFQLPDTGANFAFCILLIFLFVQIIPLPDSVLQLLSPEAVAVKQKSLPAPAFRITEGPTGQWFALSPYCYPVRMSIIRWSVYGLFFLVLTQLLNSRKRIELTTSLVLITGCFEVLYGLAQTYSGSNHIWWFKKASYLHDVTGTYINRNHFAGLMEMCLLLAAAYAAALSAGYKKRNMISGYKSSLRARVSRHLSGEQRLNKRALIVFSGAIMGIGLIFSASRAGIISAAAALLCLSLLFIFRKRCRRQGFVILSLFLITSVYALCIGVDYPVGRFKYIDTTLAGRARLAQKTMDMFQDYRSAGIGVGNFQHAYPKYQAAEDKNLFIRHAHNDWAQFLAEAGIAGFCLLLAGISYYVYQIIKLWKTRTDPFAICLGGAPLAVMTAMAIHSYFDFNLHIPANCLMLGAVMAIGHSALHLKRHRGRDKTLYRYRTMPIKYKGLLALLLILMLIIWDGAWTVRHFMAEAYCNTVTNSTINRDQDPPLEEIKKAIAWDKWNAGYWHKLARELIRIRNANLVNMEADDENRHKRRMDIIKALEEAVRLNPFRAEYHLRLGLEYAWLRQDPDYHQKWMPAADISMQRAAYFAGENNPHLHIRLGNYWVIRSRTIHTAGSEWETAWSKACRHYKKAQSLETRKTLADKIARYVWNYYPDKAFVRDVLLVDNRILLEKMK
ncbi:MAG: O-antigen ligase family protein [Desulfobacterales bacterium]|nr:O-antigen ligase family protein [Desulfobacterales bacterium]